MRIAPIRYRGNTGQKPLIVKFMAIPATIITKPI
jgi:hypothetical protein